MVHLFCMIVLFLLKLSTYHSFLCQCFLYISPYIIKWLIRVQVVSAWSGEGFLWHCSVDAYAMKRMGQKISLHYNSVRHKWPSVRCNPYFHFTSISHNILTYVNQMKSNVISFILNVCYIIYFTFVAREFLCYKNVVRGNLIGIIKGMV